jgi:alpha-beta hydrolase superfamily lysophospholipase
VRFAPLAVLVWILGAALGACATQTAPPPVAAGTSHLDEAAFVAADGAALPLRRWLPEGAPKAVVLALHGFNDYSKAFDKVPGAPGVGPTLEAAGFAVFAYDQRGFGAAPNFGFWPGADALRADATDLARQLRARYPEIPLYGLGESMGGAVLMTALAGADPPPLDGLVLVAPAVWARATMPALYRVALWIAARVVPGWRPSGQSLGRQASDNVAMLRDNGRDPLFIKQTRIDAVRGLADLMDQALAAAGRLRLPALYLYGRNDQIIPAPPSAQAMAALLKADPQARGAFYDRGWHMMLRDTQAATVLADIAAFLAAPDALLPSGADRDALARLEARAKGK